LIFHYETNPNVQAHEDIPAALGVSHGWWGIPLMGLELIGMAKRYWVPMLFLALPATMVGVFVEALIEHAFVKHLEQKRMGTETPGTPRRPVSSTNYTRSLDKRCYRETDSYRSL
jgi:hypothetical protein